MFIKLTQQGQPLFLKELGDVARLAACISFYGYHEGLPKIRQAGPTYISFCTVPEAEQAHL